MERHGISMMKFIHINRVSNYISPKKKRRLLNRAGFTLAELLATMAIMSIVMSVILGGSTALIKVYRDIKLRADAQTLMSTAVMALSEGMYTASEVEVGDDGRVTGITSDKLGKLSYSTGTTSGDKPAACIKVNDINIVSDKTQTLGLGVAFKDGPTFDSNTNTFTFTVMVSGDNVSETRTVQVHSIVTKKQEEKQG